MLESQLSDVRMLEQVLRKADLPAEVTSVDDPNEVLFAAEDEMIDIAVLNLELPGVDEALVDELRMLEGSKRLPIIAFSDSDPEDADHVFPKPREDFEYFGIVHAIRIYWLARAPTLAPPPPAEMPSERPRRLSGIDVMGLPIEPAEAYLLSMVDGRMSIDEISLSIGTQLKETRTMLRRLTELGAVAWRPPHPSLAPPPPPELPEDGPAPEPEPREPSLAPPPEPEASKKTLSAERKKIIDDAYALLGETDHYELLGVPRDAEKKAIRAAYFALAKLFHTDTLFGVELAGYAAKMNQVFRELTEAYEVLGKNKRRRAYDAYLDAVRETKALDDSPTPSLAPPAPEPEPATRASPSPRPRADEAERKRVARELLQKRLRPPPPRPNAAGAVQALARTLQAVSKSYPKEDRAARLIADAAKAEEAGNLTGAAEALRIASAWRPDDEALARRADALRARALADKAPAYEARARYAERNGSWAEAALCWMKVCEVRPDDASAALSAARALLESEGDLREGALYAKRATELEPDDAESHLLLAEVYVAAGMPASASSPLRAVLALAPGHERARALLAELAGGEDRRGRR
jgi:CheY-like chemotaxis protein